MHVLLETHGRADFRFSPLRIIDRAGETGFEELSVSGSVAPRVADLPLHHRDPFDRLSWSRRRSICRRGC